MALSPNPPFSRAGRADTQTVWEPYRSCTNTLPLDYDRCAKEKIRYKSGRGSVVLRTLPVLHNRLNAFHKSYVSPVCTTVAMIF